MPIINNYALDNYLIDGSVTGPLYATGTMARSTNYLTFTSLNYADTKYYITVSGLSFRPNRIIVRITEPTGTNGKTLSIYDFNSRKAPPGSYSESSGAGTSWNYFECYQGENGNAQSYTCFYVYEIAGNTVPNNQAYVNDSGFRLPIGNIANSLPVDVSFTWEAFRV